MLTLAIVYILHVDGRDGPPKQHHPVHYSLSEVFDWIF